MPCPTSAVEAGDLCTPGNSPSIGYSNQSIDCWTMGWSGDLIVRTGPSNTNDFDAAPNAKRSLSDGSENQRSDVDIMPSGSNANAAQSPPLAGRLALGHDYGTRCIAHNVI